jgi:hypothetical protein
MAGMFPIGVVLLGAIGAGSAVRAAWRPHRALVRDGFVIRCAGPGAVQGACDTGMHIESYRGKAEVYSPVAGRIVRVIPPGAQNPAAMAGGVIQVAAKGEPVLLSYVGSVAHGGIDPQVTVGQKVGAGQVLGMAAGVAFAVRFVQSTGGGAVTTIALEPASWLAARGLRVSAKRRAGQARQWCEMGRKLQVPQSVGQCGMKLPNPSGFMLLPVSVTME